MNPYAFLTAMAMIIVGGVIWLVISLPPYSLAGGYLIGFALNFGMWRLSRDGCRWRRFWNGFELTGVVALMAFFACKVISHRTIARWPVFLYESYRSSLPHLSTETVAWLLGHVHIFDPRANLTVIQIATVYETTYGLPMLLLALIGGGIAAISKKKPSNSTGNRDQDAPSSAQ